MKVKTLNFQIKIQCMHCLTDLELDLTDIIPLYTVDALFYGFKCAICKNANHIPDDILSLTLKQSIRKRYKDVSQ